MIFKTNQLDNAHHCQLARAVLDILAFWFLDSFKIYVGVPKFVLYVVEYYFFQHIQHINRHIQHINQHIRHNFRIPFGYQPYQEGCEGCQREY